MIGIHALARSGLVVAVLLGLIAGAVTPSVVHADTNLRLGGTARIAYANGDGVRLRAYPGQEAPVIQTISEGTLVDVIDGPAGAADGSLWYQVSVDGEFGYISEAFLADADSAPAEEFIPEESSSDEAVAADVVAETAPIPDSIPAVITGTNGDGARCRIAPNAEADVIVSLVEGAEVGVIGDAIDGWRPVVCGQQTGFIAAEFVTIVDPNNPVAPIPTEEITEEATEAPAEEVTQEATEEVTEEATDEATEEVTEEATDEATEEVTEEATDEATEEVTEEVTEEATGSPTENATDEATESPTEVATETPTDEVDESPTEEPTPAPTASEKPTEEALGTPVLSGTGVVLGTSGGGVRCRAEANDSAQIIAVLAEGSVVQVRGDAANGWLPIVCDGSDGYAASDFIQLDRFGAAPQSTKSSSAGSASSGKATISGTNGTGLRCRSSASTSASVITVLREGSAVSLRSGSTGNWQAVTCSGRSGFVSKDYLTYGSVTTAEVVQLASTGSTGSAVISGTNDDGLRCRTSASFSAAVLMVLSEGTRVTLKGKASSGFQPVLCGSKKGYVSVDYISYVSSSGSTTGQASTNGTKSAKITGTGGTGVRLRSKASTSSSIISIVPEGATVTLRNGSTGDWTAVTYKGSNGFIFKSYLKATGSTATSAGTNTGSGSSTSGLKSGNHAKATANVNLRYGAKTSAGIAAVVPQGTVVQITGSVSGGFYPVDWDGLDGYIHGDYLAKSNADLSDRNTSSGGSTSGGGGGGASPGAGSSSIVDFAMQYLGYPYVWATHGPSSFDCSGFTYWVVKNVLGRDIGAGLFTQASAGKTISQGDLQPGDLVFFQNTYTWGLSHVGIYIGGGKFIHAQNESTGVVISELGSSYYASRWYGAVRLT